MFPTMLTIPEAADACKVSSKTIRRAIHAGELRAYRPNCKTYTIREQDLLEWQSSHEYTTRA